MSQANFDKNFASFSFMSGIIIFIFIFCIYIPMVNDSIKEFIEKHINNILSVEPNNNIVNVTITNNDDNV